MIYGIVGNTALVVLVGLAAIETWGRLRDGVSWRRGGWRAAGELRMWWRCLAERCRRREQRRATCWV